MKSPRRRRSGSAFREAGRRGHVHSGVYFRGGAQKCKDIAPYVTAAVRLRPDLAPQIAGAAVKAHRRNANDASCDCIDPIIRAAIAAAPDAANAIVREAIAAAPSARACILAAAGQTETQTAFFRPPGVDAGNINSSAIGTINPANIIGNVNTDEQRP